MKLNLNHALTDTYVDVKFYDFKGSGGGVVFFGWGNEKAGCL